MIIDSTTQYKFKDTIPQVHQFCPALDNSLVLLALKKPGEDHLYHYDSQGKLIFDHNFGDFVESMCMPSEQYAVLATPETGKVHIFDLRTHERH